MIDFIVIAIILIAVYFAIKTYKNANSGCRCNKCNLKNTCDKRRI